MIYSRLGFIQQILRKQKKSDLELYSFIIAFYIPRKVLQDRVLLSLPGSLFSMLIMILMLLNGAGAALFLDYSIG